MVRSPIDDARGRLQDVLDRAQDPAVTCSFQPGGIAVLHLLGPRRRDIPVLFIDTGYHFQETLEFKDAVTRHWCLDVRVVRAERPPASQERLVGPLYKTNPDLCCEDRKTGPLFEALEAHDVWITGLRQDQTTARRGAQPIERRVLRSGRVVIKANPIVDWTRADLETYTRLHDIPVHPLLEEGYPSIGCAPCTARAPEGTRAGRWAGAKTECGLHTILDA